MGYFEQKECRRRVSQLARELRSLGVETNMPGKVVYEDEFQVAADRTPTERLCELGFEGEVVLSSSNPNEIEAYLDATELDQSG